MKASAPKRPSLGLRRNEPLGAGIRRVAREQIDTACRALQSSAEPGPAIHEARKALKKLRALLRFVAPEFSRRHLEMEKELFREASRLLGPLRDAEVRLKTLDALIQGAEFAPGEFASLRHALEAETTRLARRAGRPKSRAVELLQSARGRLRHWPLSAVENRDLIREIRRTYRKGRRALAIYQSEPGPETFHAWRKRVKELWYHLRMVRESLSPAARKRIDRLEAIGELAGDAHDLIALRQRLEAAAGVQSALLIGEIDVRLPEFYREAVKKGERFYAAAPGDFARRLT